MRREKRTITLPSELNHRLKIAAAEKKTTMGELVEQALTLYFGTEGYKKVA